MKNNVGLPVCAKMKSQVLIIPAIINSYETGKKCGICKHFKHRGTGGLGGKRKDTMQAVSIGKLVRLSNIRQSRFISQSITRDEKEHYRMIKGAISPEKKF